MTFPYQIRSLKAYQEAYRQSIEDPEAFWSEIASHFRWKTPPEKILDWNFKIPEVRWFEGGYLNITENCLDRWVETQADTLALLWESNDPHEPERRFTYRDLLISVCQCAQMLHDKGVQKGDRVCIYMPMVPELLISVLACARLGAIHSVIFGGFSAQSIADRINDARCTLVITADGAFRGDKIIPLKSVMDEALIQCRGVNTVIVLERAKVPVSMQKGRDVWWHDEWEKVPSLKAFEAVDMQSEDPLFILYTSGSTGKPKGVVHSCAGYMVYTNYSFVNVFQYQPGDVFFCTADIGWITGHSYLIYGPLSAGATCVMFEGIPTWPDAGRFWDIIDKYQVNIFYTAPTAIRSLMSMGTAFPEQRQLNSLKVLGSVGEPINEEAWHWFHQHIGKGVCPLVDTWWQTETGGILISNLAGITPSKPGYATLPLPGVRPVLLDEQGRRIAASDAAGEQLPPETIRGNLCIEFPWPSILRTTWGDHERCRTTYFSAYPDLYFTGDGCLRDTEGNYRITGRVDDVLNVSGHRIGTAELENAINQHTGVIESAVVAYPHAVKGQGVYAFVVMSPMPKDLQMTALDINQTITRLIGPIAKADKVQLVSALPKTRSGKIMRRILRKIAEGDTENLGDVSTLLDPAVVDAIKEGRI